VFSIPRQVYGDNDATPDPKNVHNVTATARNVFEATRHIKQ